MAGTYSTDINTLSAGTTGTPVEATAYAAATNPISNDGDVYLQGVSSYTALSPQKSANQGLSLLYNNGSPITATDGHVVNIWALWPFPSGLSTYNAAIPGAQLVVGSALGTIRTYVVDGSDTFPYGGWKLYTVDLRNTPTGATTGYTGNTPQYIGIAYYIIVAFNRPVLFALDTVRYGRMTMSATAGNSTSINHVTPLNSSAANFPQMADYNDYNGGGTPSFGAARDGGYHRFGQCQAVDGGYLLRGVINLGNTTTSVYFDDANRNLFINDDYLTYNDFNRIEIRNASSTCKLNSCSFSFIPRPSTITSGDAPAEPHGNFEMIDNALVQLTSCSFTDMGTFTFLQGATGSVVSDTTFRRCQTVFPNSMAITESLFVNTQSATGSIQFDSVADGANVTYCNFENNTVGPAIRITSEGTYTFTGHQFTNNTTDVEFTGTGNCIIVPAAASNVANVTATGGGNIIIAAPTVEVRVTGLEANSEVRFYTGDIDLPGTAVELAGTEASGNTFSFFHSVGGQTGFYQIFNLDYLPIYRAYTYKNTDDDILIFQTGDRQYSNPV